MNITEEEINRRMEARTATVGSFTDYLSEHFSDSDKLCRIECIEGFKYELVPVAGKDLGRVLFRKISKVKEDLASKGRKRTYADGMFPYVSDEHVLIT